MLGPYTFDEFGALPCVAKAAHDTAENEQVDALLGCLRSAETGTETRQRSRETARVLSGWSQVLCAMRHRTRGDTEGGALGTSEAEVAPSEGVVGAAAVVRVSPQRGALSLVDVVSVVCSVMMQRVQEWLVVRAQMVVRLPKEALRSAEFGLQMEGVACACMLANTCKAAFGAARATELKQLIAWAAIAFRQLGWEMDTSLQRPFEATSPRLSFGGVDALGGLCAEGYNAQLLLRGARRLALECRAGRHAREWRMQMAQEEVGCACSLCSKWVGRGRGEWMWRVPPRSPPLMPPRAQANDADSVAAESARGVVQAQREAGWCRRHAERAGRERCELEGGAVGAREEALESRT